MHVLAIHEISDPEGFQAAEERLEAEIAEDGWSEGVRGNPITLFSPDHRHEFCLFEADSVEAVRALVEEKLAAPWSKNTYVEIDSASVPALKS